MKIDMMEMNAFEIDQISAAGTCGQDVAGSLAAGAGIVGVAFAPVSFGVSLGAAALFGLAAGMFAGLAQESCK